MTTVIGGAGPAGIMCARALAKFADYGIKVILIEAGGPPNDRLKECTEENMLNGFGGAALWSDRKFSAPPAGSGLFNINSRLLRESYNEIIDDLMTCVGDESKEKFRRLKQDVDKFFGINDSQEVFDKRVNDYADDGTKVYSSAVLSDINEAHDIIKHYEKELEGVDIRYNTYVIECDDGDDGLYTILTTKGVIRDVKYVVNATGRFGRVQGLCDHQTDHDINKVELGVRLNSDTVPGLIEALKMHAGDNDMCHDVKIRDDITIVCPVTKRVVDAQMRTHCICINDDNNGYVVSTYDIASNVRSCSGSSSASEIRARSRHEFVHPGSNIGILIRITDQKFIDDNWKAISDIMKKNVTVKNTTMLSLGKDLDFGPLSSIMSQGIKHLIYKIVGVEEEDISKDDGNYDWPIKITMPCIECCQNDTDVDDKTLMLKDNPNMFAIGDVCGFARGLLQGMVMGRVVASEIASIHNDEQNVNPMFRYKKVLPTLLIRDRDVDVPIIEVADMRSRIDEISEDLVLVEFTGEQLGELCEFHHFFLDRDTYTDKKVLHYVTDIAVYDYQFIVRCLQEAHDNGMMIDTVIRSVSDKLGDDKEMAKESLMSIIDNKIKACLLSLRMRDNLDSENYTDVPIMQSAVKFYPARRSCGKFNDAINVYKYVTAAICAYIDTMAKTLIHRHDLNLILVRSKIETQVASMKVITSPLYLECHVKFCADEPYEVTQKNIQLISHALEKNSIFRTISVSTNMLKHPTYHNQMFLTFRTNDIETMRDLSKNFTKIVNDNVIESLQYYKHIPDSEIIVYDDNRHLDKGWFFESDKFLR